MTLKAKIASIFGFRVLPTSILVVITYFALFISLIATDVLPDPPAVIKRGGLDLKQAYEDLLHITAHPHPYNSHANDRVRVYLLQRLQDIAQEYPHIHVDDDMKSNGSWAGQYGIYFEGTNLLVKIEGTSSSSSDDASEEEDGVLFSAHYDSVSTAPGAADDGMGVVTLLQLVEYFAINRMPKTAVFNINNGEEDWLNGAHAFLQHPWSNLTDTFLNLEGAAAGGWPILFRATSTSAVKAFRNTKRVPHPHANVLSADGFARGLIRSGTDYSVYSTPGPRKGMDGLDLAFYKGRSKYHTKYDAVSFTVGGQRSLWSMMETARGVGVNLLSVPDGAEKDESVPVYFDLFKSAILVFSITKLFTLNVVALVGTPIILISIALCEYCLIQSKRSLLRVSELPDLPLPRIVRLIQWLFVIWRHIKFWVALVVVIAMQYLLLCGYVMFNPFALYSLPYTVLSAFVSLTYLTLVFVLTFPSSLPFYWVPNLNVPWGSMQSPAQRQKRTIFLHLFIFTWILLVISTVGITQLTPPVGGGYLITTWNLAVGLACILVAAESLVLTFFRTRPRPQPQIPQIPEEPLRFSQPLRWPDERTPLIPRNDGSLLPSLGELTGDEDAKELVLATCWWIPQFLISVPIPITLFAHVATMLLDAMAQTLGDGPSPWDVYLPCAISALILVLPLAPFSYKLQPFRPLTMLAVLVFVLSTLYTWLAFPFTVQDPLKVYFQQRVILPRISTPLYGTGTRNVSTEVQLITALIGPEKYLRSAIVPLIPSSQKDKKPITCGSTTSGKSGLTECSWASGESMMPFPGTLMDGSDNTWGQEEFFKADVAKTGEGTARIHVRGRNTRSCRLYFNRTIFRYDVLMNGLLSEMQKGYEIPGTGIKEIRLWSRRWENEFVVDVDWRQGMSDVGGLEGRIGCEWNEYESGMLDNGPLWNQEKAKIPAFEEVVHFLPQWAAVSKFADGLVEAWAPFGI